MGGLDECGFFKGMNILENNFYTFLIPMLIQMHIL